MRSAAVSAWWANSRVASVACNGAKLDDIYGGPDRSNSGATQLSAVTSSTQMVALTGGGNDLGFGPTILSCRGWAAAVGGQAAGTTPCPYIPVDDIPDQAGRRANWDGIYDEMVDTYVAIRRQMAPAGSLFVLTYPLFFADPGGWATPLCDGTWGAESARRINQGVVRLGDTTYWAVQEANRRLAAEGREGNVVFVDQRVTSPSGPWEPKGLCGPATFTGDSSVRSSTGLYPHGYHPTRNSYARAATKFSEALNAQLGRRFGDPYGAFDIVSSPGAGKVSVRGWAIDPNTAGSPISVHVYVGGRAGTPGADVTGVTASTSRPDVGSAYPGTGNSHGYDAVVPTRHGGTQLVCVYAINVGPGASNPELGCKTVTFPRSAPANGPVFTVMNTDNPPPDGVYFRNSAAVADTERITGLGVYRNEQVRLRCYAWGEAVGPFANRLWYRADNVTRTNVGARANSGLLNARYINDGTVANQVVAGVPAC